MILTSSPRTTACSNHERKNRSPVIGWSTVKLRHLHRMKTRPTSGVLSSLFMTNKWNNNDNNYSSHIAMPVQWSSSEKRHSGRQWYEYSVITHIYKVQIVILHVVNSVVRPRSIKAQSPFWRPLAAFAIFKTRNGGGLSGFFYERSAGTALLTAVSLCHSSAEQVPPLFWAHHSPQESTKQAMLSRFKHIFSPVVGKSIQVHMISILYGTLYGDPVDLHSRSLLQRRSTMDLVIYLVYNASRLGSSPHFDRSENILQFREQDATTIF